ncbi:hypothetical protein ES703_117310 [subsurface metagenome]
MIKLFIAAGLASGPPIPIKRYKVKPRKPQKTISSTKLLANNAPQPAPIVHSI